MTSCAGSDNTHLDVLHIHVQEKKQLIHEPNSERVMNLFVWLLRFCPHTPSRISGRSVVMGASPLLSDGYLNG